MTSTWTNNSGQAQNYTFNFGLFNSLTASTFSIDGAVQAGFSADIFLNGVSVWHTSQNLFVDDVGPHLSSTGVDIGPGQVIGTPNTFAFNAGLSNNYLGALNLGTLANGGTFTVQYVVSSFGGEMANNSNCGWECQKATSNTDGWGNINQVSAVPEPETYALLLAGLGVISSVARRRKQKVSPA